MKMLNALLIVLVVGWFVIATVAALTMPPLAYKFESWLIVACGPMVLLVAAQEVLSRVFGGRGKNG